MQNSSITVVWSDSDIHCYCPYISYYIRWNVQMPHANIEAISCQFCIRSRLHENLRISGDIGTKSLILVWFQLPPTEVKIGKSVVKQLSTAVSLISYKSEFTWTLSRSRDNDWIWILNVVLISVGNQKNISVSMIAKPSLA